MSNYDEHNQATIAKFVLENLPSHKQCALATTGGNGAPWVVCVNLTYDKQLHFIWKSRTDALHSQYLRERPAVSICVFSENEMRGDFGFYATATAHEVTDSAELEHLIDIRFTQKGKPAPAPNELLGDSPMRLYVAELHEAWINDDQHIKSPVDLDFLRATA